MKHLAQPLGVVKIKQRRASKTRGSECCGRLAGKCGSSSERVKLSKGMKAAIAMTDDNAS